LAVVAALITTASATAWTQTSSNPNQQQQPPATEPSAPANQQTAPATPAEQAAPAPANQAEQAAPNPEGQTVHILVGRSVIVNTQARLRRVVVGNPAVVETVTTSPTQVVVTAKSAGSSSLLLFDESGTTRMLDVFGDVDVSALRDAIQHAYPETPIQIDSQEDKIVLTGSVPSAAAAEQIGKMASTFSRVVVNSLNANPAPRRKQVMLKVRFAEVDRSKLSQIGFNIFSTGAGNTPGTISTQQFGTLSLGSQGTVRGTIGAPTTGTTTSIGANDLLNIFLFRPDLNLGTTIKALQNNNVLQILAEPNLLAMSGEPARFLAGGEFPYPVVQTGGGLNTVTIQFRPFGVRLEFTATVEPDGVINLKVAPEVSSLDYSNAITVSGFTMPAISTRRAETQIELKDGQSFGIAGLLDNRTTAQMSKIPGIGDVPIIGQFFKSRNVSKSNTELLVLVTPALVDPLTSPAPAAAPIHQPLKNLDPKTFDKGLPGGTPGR
jgi:pilus assembly protein CpaC